MDIFQFSRLGDTFLKAFFTLLHAWNKGLYWTVNITAKHYIQYRCIGKILSNIFRCIIGKILKNLSFAFLAISLKGTINHRRGILCEQYSNWNIILFLFNFVSFVHWYNKNTSVQANKKLSISQMIMSNNFEIPLKTLDMNLVLHYSKKMRPKAEIQTKLFF